ncbi:hypothetical protein ES703_126003 [subsurface metagenome]
MLELENCIGYWKRTLFHDKFLMSPAVQVIIESTVKHLENYKEILDTQAVVEDVNKDINIS